MKHLFLSCLPISVVSCFFPAYRKASIFFLVSFIFFLVPSSLSAQEPEFKVSSFTHEDNSLLARLNSNLRLDDNDEACALILVRTAETGLGFTSNTGTVGNADWKNGDYWVYVSQGARSIKIFKQGIKTVEYIFEIIPQSRETYLLELQVLRPEPKVKMYPVTIRFTPSDATLSIDGKTVKPSATHNLPEGVHRLQITKADFQPIEQTIQVDDKNVFFEYSLVKQADAVLQIETIPDGAIVYLDGIKLGESPISAFYKPGNYPIKITKEGFLSIENQTLDVLAPKTFKSYTLEENVGYLTINTNPLASVYINEEKITNTKDIKLAPQLLKIKVMMPKAETLEQQIVLKRNDKQVIELYPHVQTGSLQIAVTPFEAVIEITGDAAEHYTATGSHIFEDIPVGAYTIKVSANSYTSASETATVKQGETINKSLKLLKPTATSPDSPDSQREGSTSFLDMVLVKRGTFQMGSNSGESDEKPVHSVTLSDFYIGKYEVTQKQWQEIMGTNPSYFSGCDNCPVENVSWNDVQEFIKKLNQKTGKNYRLPTEAEWEYAAQGGNQSKGTIYSGSNNIDEVAWFWNNAGSKTHPAGTKMANELGIYDMSGNVWEWCSDWKGNYSSGSQTNPRGPSSGLVRVDRGGSWYDMAQLYRLAYRRASTPDDRTNSLGFRLALPR